jgi:hypothetical protein
MHSVVVSSPLSPSFSPSLLLFLSLTFSLHFLSLSDDPWRINDKDRLVGATLRGGNG